MYVLLSFPGLCRHLKFSPPVDGYALQGHVIKAISLNIYLVENIPSRCNNYCTMESKCASFNIGPSIKDIVLCQLNDADHIQHPKDLQAREGFMYRGTEVSKSNWPLYFCFWFSPKVIKANCMSKNRAISSSQNSCSSNPCLHNETCLNGFTATGYFCECQDGYSGEQCEKGNVTGGVGLHFLRVQCTLYETLL